MRVTEERFHKKFRTVRRPTRPESPSSRRTGSYKPVELWCKGSKVVQDRSINTYKGMGAQCPNTLISEYEISNRVSVHNSQLTTKMTSNLYKND